MHVWVTVTESTFRGMLVRRAFFQRKSFLPSPMSSAHTERALPRQSASRMLRAMHAAHNPLALGGRRYCYVEDNARLGKHQESAIRTLHQGFQNTQSCLYDVLYCHGQKGRQSSSGALPMSAPHPRRSLDSSYRGPRDLSMYSRIRL